MSSGSARPRSARTTRKKRSIFGLCHPKVGSSARTTCFPASVKAKIRSRRKRSGSSVCRFSSDRCTLENSELSDEEKSQLAKKYLRPPRPARWTKTINQFNSKSEWEESQWLGNDNLEEVMHQYEEAYPDFKFLGTLPIDFAAPDPYSGNKDKCIVDKLCHLDIKKMAANGIHRLGSIYNLDPHYKDGSHWVASWINLQKKEVCYFDSYGIKPPQQIARFMRSLTIQDPTLKLAFNARRFQFQGSECGMYCLYFLISMLEGMAFKQFCQHAVADDEMVRLRKWLFS